MMFRCIVIRTGCTTYQYSVSQKRSGSMVLSRAVESELESPMVRVLARSRSLSFEGDSDSGSYLSHLDICLILLQSI